MDDVNEITAFVEEFDTGCWQEAIKGHNAGLKKGPRSPKFIHVGGGETNNAAIKARVLLDQALKTTTSFSARRGQLTQAFVDVNCLLIRHAKSIDVFSQLQPNITGIVWGSVRIILEVIQDKEEASTIAIQGIRHLLWHFDRWKDIATIFPRENRIRGVVVQLYEHVLGFLQRAMKHLGTGTWKRLGKSIVASQKDKIRVKLDQVKDTARILDGEFGIEAVLHNNQQLAVIENKFDRLMDELAAVRACGGDKARWEQFTTSNMDIIQRFFNSQQDTSMSNSKAALKWLAREPTLTSAHVEYEHTEGTGQWLFARPEMRHWLDDSNARMLWVQGNLGCGKSVLSKLLADRLEADYEAPVILCSFQVSSTPQVPNPSTTLAVSLLHHVLRAVDNLHDPSSGYPSVLNDLYELTRAHPHGPQTCPSKKLWSICSKALRLLPQDFPCFLIIDALDACRFDETPTLEEFVGTLERVSRSSSLRIAIFSRPQPDLSRFTLPDLRISIEETLVAGDILRFSSSKFDSLGISATYKEVILQQIAMRSKGCILWAKVFLKHLSEPCSDDVFLERVYRSPPGLWAIYDQTIQDVAGSMDDSQTSLRRNLFVLMCEAQELLSLNQIASILSLGRFNDPKEVIAQIGRPLLSIAGERVSFVHCSVKEYLTDQNRCPQTGRGLLVFAKSVQSHSRLAEECLKCLHEPEYGLKGRIGQIIHRNFGSGTLVEEDMVQSSSQGISYEYAWKYWGFHLTKISDPEAKLLNLLQTFLHELQFAYWSEYSLYRLDGNFSKIGVMAFDLRKWHRQLPEGKKPLTKIDDYFDAPYRRLVRAFEKSEDEDRELPYLALMRLGSYFINLGMGDKAIPVLDMVAKGLDDLLGSTHPLTLRSKTDRAVLYLQKGKFIEANRDFAEIARIEERELGMVDNTELYKTLLCRGGAELLLNRYDQSLATQKKAALGFLRLSGPEDSQYLSARMWYCYVLIEMGKLNPSLNILSCVFQKRREQYGDGDVFAATAQQCIGDVQRKQGRPSESLANLREALATRKAAGLSGIWVMDTAIALLIALRDFGMREDARATLRDLDREGDVGRHFDRYCQVEHLRALLGYDDGKRRDAINLLRGLLIDAEREQYNRALMWIMLDLAIMLRARGKDGDREEAEANFHNILVDLERHVETENTFEEGSSGGWPGGGLEPDPPRLLLLAEQALTLVRNREFGNLEALFVAEKVDWARPKDLWLSYGAPAADTAWMKGPV